METPTQHLDMYDAIFDGVAPGTYSSSSPWEREALASTGHTRLFGNARIGWQELTNMQVAGQITFGTAWICNWYARTNIPACKELDDWAHSTLVRLQIGSRYTHQMHLHELLARTAGFVMPLHGLRDGALPDTKPAEEQISSVARRALAAYQAITGSRDGMFDLPIEQQSAWMNVGQTLLETFRYPPVVVVPVRQNVSVEIDGNPEAFRALQAVVARLGEGEGSEGERPIMPRARAWIHLEGFTIPREDKLNW